MSLNPLRRPSRGSGRRSAAVSRAPVAAARPAALSRAPPNSSAPLESALIAYIKLISSIK